MTPEQIKNNREKFEALELSKGNPINYDQINDDRYFCEYQQNRWEGYLLCAENMEVVLPKSEMWSFETSTYEIYHVVDVWNALQSQGIKIKSSGSE